MGEERKRTRREYTMHQGKKIARVIGAVLITLLVMAGILCGGNLVTHEVIGGDHYPWLIISFVIVLTFSAVFYVGTQSARRIVGIVRAEPVTHHNTGNLPEDEILVRASEEPPAHQADVLLRAVQGGQETAEEQLLRPVE